MPHKGSANDCSILIAFSFVPPGWEYGGVGAATGPDPLRIDNDYDANVRI